MARNRANMIFVVTSHVPADDTVFGIAFPDAQKAQKFATALTKAARRLAAKTLNLNKEDAKAFAKTLPLDILMQNVDKEGNPIGDPGLFGSEGLEGLEADEEGDEEGDEE